jgi:hypothetical protein
VHLCVLLSIQLFEDACTVPAASSVHDQLHVAGLQAEVPGAPADREGPRLTSSELWTLAAILGARDRDTDVSVEVGVLQGEGSVGGGEGGEGGSASTS